MFSKKQELEYNVAFLKEMIQSSGEDLNHWQSVNEGYQNDVDKIVKQWTNFDGKPTHALTMMAWTKKAIELLKNRLQQNELKLKELDSERSPAEWAVLGFQQSKILVKMEEINIPKTRMLCRDLNERLIGPQYDFKKSPPRAVKGNGSQKPPKLPKKVSNWQKSQVILH